METKKLYKAISDFQNEVPVIHQESSGYGYTYANLNSIFKIINPLLKKHGIGFTQLLDGDALRTIIFHIDSGESLESKVNIQQGVSLAKMNAYQVLGSAITYYRRYSLSAALGLITDKDIDASAEPEKTKPDNKTADKKFLNIGTKQYAATIEKLKAKETTLEVVKQFFNLSPETEQDLIRQAK
jgi:ERF superfamily protein